MVGGRWKSAIDGGAWARSRTEMLILPKASVQCWFITIGQESVPEKRQKVNLASLFFYFLVSVGITHWVINNQTKLGPSFTSTSVWPKTSNCFVKVKHISLSPCLTAVHNHDHHHHCHHHHLDCCLPPCCPAWRTGRWCTCRCPAGTWRSPTWRACKQQLGCNHAPILNDSGLIKLEQFIFFVPTQSFHGHLQSRDIFWCSSGAPKVIVTKFPILEQTCKLYSTNTHCCVVCNTQVLTRGSHTPPSCPGNLGEPQGREIYRGRSGAPGTPATSSSSSTWPSPSWSWCSDRGEERTEEELGVRVALDVEQRDPRHALLRYLGGQDQHEDLDQHDDLDHHLDQQGDLDQGSMIIRN